MRRGRADVKGSGGRGHLPGHGVWRERLFERFLKTSGVTGLEAWRHGGMEAWSGTQCSQHNHHAAFVCLATAGMCGTIGPVAAETPHLSFHTHAPLAKRVCCLRVNYMQAVAWVRLAVAAQWSWWGAA